MSRQRARDTAVELALRQRLHAAGLRYRVHVRPLPALRRTADIVFGPARVAVFVDGCFWHGCSEHKTIPASNREFWEEKIGGNIRRDADTRRRLTEAGWLYIQVWEHDDPDRAASSIADSVTARRQDVTRAKPYAG
jgi:DNA mismatch endonuclease (patch repair protein)